MIYLLCLSVFLSPQIFNPAITGILFLIPIFPAVPPFRLSAFPPYCLCIFPPFRLSAFPPSL
jgi:hypothetical protein